MLFFSVGKANESMPWSIQGLQIQSNINGVTVQSDAVELLADHQLTALSYHCPDNLTLFPRHRCDDAQLTFSYGQSHYEVSLDTQFDFHTTKWSLELKTANEQISLALASDRALSGLTLSDWQLQTALTQALPAEQSPSGLFNGQLLVDVQQLRVMTDAPLVFSDLNYEYSDDIIVAGLGGELSLALDVPESKLSYELTITAGEMLVDQLYVDFSSFPVTMNGLVTANSTGWFDTQLTINNPQSMDLVIQAEVNDDLLWRKPRFNLAVKDSHHFNQQILSGVLGIYGFAGSGMSGQFELSAAADEQALDQWSVSFDDYYFLNDRRKIAAESMTGTVNWQQNKEAQNSVLAWDALLLAGLPIEAADIHFNLSQDELTLLGAHEFPVFDGGIELQSLELKSLFSEFIDMNLNASIKPMSLNLITEKLGWAEMSGTISGEIPGMVKKGSVISFLGALNLSVFDGEMLVENLSIERLFGVAPVIAADVTFDGFDLSLLTKTFGFGLITGKLSGLVKQLRITNWKTDRLDAQVYTVKTKGVKQIISQRAIDNISSLGGIKGAISKTFLRFFDDFRYKKIKLSCKLHNSVCAIGGLKNQGNQFVIVEGGGIPKINIVGFVRSINWEEFIDRLLNANYSN